MIGCPSVDYMIQLMGMRQSLLLPGIVSPQLLTNCTFTNFALSIHVSVIYAFIECLTCSLRTIIVSNELC